MRHFVAISFIVALISACAPKISTSITNTTYAPLEYNEDVVIFDINAPFPTSAEELGTVKVGDNGLSIDCSYHSVIEVAKLEARKVGGNAVKVTKYTPPNMASSCHRITVSILRVHDFGEFVEDEQDSVLINADYALLHIYRHSGVGAWVGYDLYLDDSLICRVKNRWKSTVRIKREGLGTLWARTEVKEELPIDIKLGREYYIRCSIDMGIMVGRPRLELIENRHMGKSEMDAIKMKRNNQRDIVVLLNGQERECIIEREDEGRVYVTIFSQGKALQTYINKDEIKNIYKNGIKDNEDL